LGILAHVDAGKTSLTERLLYAAGVIDQIGSVDDGSTQTDSFADRDDAFLAAYVDDETTVSYCQLRGGLAAQTRQALVHPVFFGSAITGAGVDSLTAGIAELLPAAEGDADGPVSGTVFKVERGPAGEKIAYVRLFSGTVRTRDRLRFRGASQGKVTVVCVFDRGSAVQRPSVAAGQIGKLWGLGDIQIGDTIGVSATTSEGHHSRRAGPADQPAAGRYSAGTLRLALR